MCLASIFHEFTRWSLDLDSPMLWTILQCHLWRNLCPTTRKQYVCPKTWKDVCFKHISIQLPPILKVLVLHCQIHRNMFSNSLVRSQNNTPWKQPSINSGAKGTIHQPHRQSSFNPHVPATCSIPGPCLPAYSKIPKRNNLWITRWGKLPDLLTVHLKGWNNPDCS